MQTSFVLVSEHKSGLLVTGTENSSGFSHTERYLSQKGICVAGSRVGFRHSRAQIMSRGSHYSPSLFPAFNMQLSALGSTW